MDGFLANAIKYLLFATNFAVFVMGCVVLGIGIFALVDGAALVDLVENTGSGVSLSVFTSAAIILIVVAVFVVIVTFFGCCGAIKENKCMLGTYFAAILVMFIIMIVGAVIGYSQSLSEVEDQLILSMAKFKDDPGEDKTEIAITTAWNTVQEDFNCCGMYFANGNNSWTKENPGQYPTAAEFRVPASCCTQFVSADQSKCRKTPFAYNLTGCFDQFETLLDKNKNNVLAVGVTIVVVMFLNMLFAFAMCTMAN